MNDAGSPAEVRWTLLFDSIHDVLAAEQALRACGAWCDVVPAPRSLSADCGMAIEVRAEEAAAVRAALAAPRLRPRRVVQVAGGHWKEAGWPV